MRIAVLVGFLILLLAPLVSAAPEMSAHFINVGQGDATLLEFPCGAVLIDSGTQYKSAFAADKTNLIHYLEKFFTRRSDLQNTIDLIIISHNHLDHTLELRRIAERFRVKRYIDNGRLNGDGATNAVWIRTNTFPAGQQITIRQILEADIPTTPTGLTDADIELRVQGSESWNRFLGETEVFIFCSHSEQGHFLLLSMAVFGNHGGL